MLLAQLFTQALERLRARCDEEGYDRLVVYADREHSANLAYLTGFDPRFEEAALVVDLRNATGANGKGSDKVWKL